MVIPVFKFNAISKTKGVYLYLLWHLLGNLLYEVFIINT